MASIKYRLDNKNRQLLECVNSNKPIAEKLIDVRRCLDQRADVNTTDDNGNTPLHLIVRRGCTLIVKLLLKRGADANAGGKFGNTPLLEAVRYKQTTVVKLLLNQGADVNKPDKFGYTPLYLAAGIAQTSLVELLLNKDADVNALDINGRTPLHNASLSRSKSVVEQLLNKGADAKAKSLDDDTPLHYAVKSGEQSIVELLLDKGADVKAKNSIGDTPLHYAASSGKQSIVQLLLKYGADVNAQAADKYTPLHWATRSRKKSVVELLLKEGANVNLQARNGNTPLHETVRIADAANAALLVQHRGTDVMLKNSTNDTPLSYALLFPSHDNTAIVSMLQNAEKEAISNAVLNNHQSQIMHNSFQSDDSSAILNNTLHNNEQYKYLKSTDTSGLPGQLNETKMLSLVFIRVLNHKQIEHDIFLGANIDGIGAMDDICLRYRVRSLQSPRPVVLFIQAKHKEDSEKGKLTDTALWSDSGDFSLLKYFKSYLMIRERFQVSSEDPMFEGEFCDVDCYFILYTSAKESVSELKKTNNNVSEIMNDILKTAKNTEPFQYRYDKIDLDRLAEVAAAARIEKLEANPFPNLNPTENDEKNAKDFFSRLWFYPCQAKEDEIELIVKREIGKLYNNEKDENHFKFALHSNAIFLKVHYVIQKWWMQRGKAPYLSRSNDFFSRAKLACLDNVLLAVVNAMYNLKISRNPKLNFYLKQCNTAVETSSFSNTMLCRLLKTIDTQNNLITVDVDFSNKIVKLLLTDDKPPFKNALPSSGQSKSVVNKQFKYPKRVGTSEIGGTLLRTKMLSLVYIRALNHERIEQDHLLGTKTRGFSVINDISLRYRVKGQQKPVVLFVQLIHRDDFEKGQLTIEEVWRDSGNFSLRKYFASYLKIKELFQVNNRDPMFEGNFCDVDCHFLLCTSANESLNKKTTKRKLSKVVQDLISTGLNKEPFQYDYDEADLCRLSKVITMNRIEKLGSVFLKYVMQNKYDPTILMDKLIGRYHVAIGREVLKQCNEQPKNKEYRLWEFRPDFFENKLDYLVTLRKTFAKILRSKSRDKKNIAEFKQTILSKEERNNLESFKIKFPPAFGNLDMTFYGNKEKVQIWMKKVADILMDLLKSNKGTNIVEINDNDVGRGKTIEQGIIDIKGGIGGAVGNLLVSDTNTNMLKFDLENKSLLQNAASFLNELKNDRYEPLNKDLSIYRIKINIDSFPKDSFHIDEYDKEQARDFISRFWFYTNQAKENEVERILKDLINEKYSGSNILHDNKVRSTSDLISLHFTDDIQKWWMQTSESPYLSRASELFERAELADICNLLQTVINYMYITRISSIEIKTRPVENTTDAMQQVFKQFSDKLFNLFDPKFHESYYFTLHNWWSDIMNTAKISLSIHPDMEWVAITLEAESEHNNKNIYRIVAKVTTRSAREGFMVTEQCFDASNRSRSRECLKKDSVNDYEERAIIYRGIPLD